MWLLGLGGLLGCGTGEAAVGASTSVEPLVTHIAGQRTSEAHVATLAPGVDVAQQAAAKAPVSQRDVALERDLQELVDSWFQHARKASRGKLRSEDTQISVSVRDAKTGAVLADLRAARSLRPASNLKLITTAAALALLGPDGHYLTRFETRGQIAGGVLQGDLIVRAGGDPVVKEGSGGRVEAYFEPLIEALGAAGIDKITGEVVLDEGDFLEPGVGPAWPSSDQHWKDYCAFAAGLTLNGGVLEARVAPGAVGKPASVELHPRPTGLMRRVGVTTKGGSLNDVRVGATSSQVTVKGAIGALTPPVDAAFRHPDPVGLFETVLRSRLDQAGISVEGGFARRRGPPAGELLVAIASPIADSLVPINTHSTNGVADQLFFKLGHDFGKGGTRAGGQKAVRLALDRIGVSSAGLRQVDGSGLSRENRVAPEQLTALCWSALSGFDKGVESARLYKESLAVMGRTGTLEDRMRGTPSEGRVFAKTGFIDGTSALGGLALTQDGRAVIFSILVNYPTLGGLNNSAWKPMQEAMVARLVQGANP